MLGRGNAKKERKGVASGLHKVRLGYGEVGSRSSNSSHLPDGQILAPHLLGVHQLLLATTV